MTSAITPIRLRCEHLENPLGIDETQPRLSWLLEATGRSRRQTAYQILASSTLQHLETDQGDLWDSGKTASDESVLIAYNGSRLISRQRVWWKVRVWDEGDQVSNWSESQFWEMALLEASDWQAQWLELDQGELRDAEASPYFRKSFKVDVPIKSARLYVTARGVYEARLNGSRISDALLAPGWTDYRTRIQYQTYDVTELVTQGENALGAMVGDGWYCGQLGWTHAEKHTRHYGNRPQFLAQLELHYSDGRRETICSDSSWRATTAAILHSDLYHGEHYDARLEISGWDMPAFDDANWQQPTVHSRDQVRLVAERSEPVRALEAIKPISITEHRPGCLVVDFGQNITGWMRLEVEGAVGATVQMRFAEILEPTGGIYTDNLRSARQTDSYTLKGHGLEVFEPRFTFHGFRYVEVTGYPGTLEPSALTARFVGSDTPLTGQFETSNELVNQLQRNIVWGQRDNFLSIPTDCPQRDERLGWLGDAQVFVRTASFNADVAAFFTKWMNDVTDAQSSEGAYSDVAPRLVDEADGAPAWADAGVIVPWTLYTQYADKQILERHWAAMERYMHYIAAANPNHLRLERLNNNFGDWLAVDGDNPTDAFGSLTPKELLATAYWAYDADLMSRMARALGRSSDVEKYQRLFERIKTAFNAKYVNADGTIEGDTQTAYVLALYMNLLPLELQTAAATHLIRTLERKDWHLTTGFVGVGYLCPVLTQIGRIDVAYKLLLNDTYPSWGYSIRHGATTIWERWNGWTEDGGFEDPGMNSFNHYSLGSVGQWLYQTVAGIDFDPSLPGFKGIIIRPQPGGGLTHVKAEYASIRGTISSAWNLEHGQFNLQVTIPANTSARVYLTAGSQDAITESSNALGQAENVKFVRLENGVAMLEIGSGSYSFVVKG